VNSHTENTVAGAVATFSGLSVAFEVQVADLALKIAMVAIAALVGGVMTRLGTWLGGKVIARLDPEEAHRRKDDPQP